MQKTFNPPQPPQSFKDLQDEDCSESRIKKVCVMVLTAVTGVPALASWMRYGSGKKLTQEVGDRVKRS